MTDAQLFGLLASHRRGYDGIPEFPPLPDEKGSVEWTPYGVYRHFLRHAAGITDRATQERLWKAEQVERKRREDRWKTECEEALEAMRKVTILKERKQ